MQIKFYNNISDRRVINKNITEIKTLTGTLRQQCDIMKPVFNTVKDNDLLYANYVYIPQFNRYFFINNITVVSNNILQFDCEIDVLESHKTSILNLLVIADKQENIENANKYFDDSSNVIDSRIVNQTINFANGFNDNGEFILVTAGA